MKKKKKPFILVFYLLKEGDFMMVFHREQRFILKFSVGAAAVSFGIYEAGTGCSQLRSQIFVAQQFTQTTEKKWQPVVPHKRISNREASGAVLAAIVSSINFCSSRI